MKCHYIIIRITFKMTIPNTSEDAEQMKLSYIAGKNAKTEQPLVK